MRVARKPLQALQLHRRPLRRRGMQAALHEALKVKAVKQRRHGHPITHTGIQKQIVQQHIQRRKCRLFFWSRRTGRVLCRFVQAAPPVPVDRQ